MGRLNDTSLLYESGYNKGFKDGIKGSIPKDQYEARLKDDLVAMLIDLQLDVEEQKFDVHIDRNMWNDAIGVCSDLIQQKINAMKGAER